VVGDHRGLVEGQQPVPQGLGSSGQLVAPLGDRDHVSSVRRRQTGPHNQVVLRGTEPSLAPVLALDQLDGHLDQLALRPVEPPRDLGRARPQRALLLVALHGCRAD
jgi:hypothetical protein